MNLHADPRALQQAQNAETQRMRRANRGSLEEENDQRRARCIIPGVQEHESAQQAAAREDGMTRQNENNQRCLRECLTAVCKALSLANAKGKGTDGLVIRS